jgi:hypothetical protein
MIFCCLQTSVVKTLHQLYNMHYFPLIYAYFDSIQIYCVMPYIQGCYVRNTSMMERIVF